MTDNHFSLWTPHESAAVSQGAGVPNVALTTNRRNHHFPSGHPDFPELNWNPPVSQERMSNIFSNLLNHAP